MRAFYNVSAAVGILLFAVACGSTTKEEKGSLADKKVQLEQLRADGHTVYLHCEDATRRTPAVAALYGARKRGIGVDQALQEVLAALPGAELRPDLISSLHRLHPNTGSGK